MNRNILIGVVAGIGIAVAGGVAGFTMMGSGADSEGQMMQDVAAETSAEVPSQAQPAAAAPVAAAPAPAAPAVAAAPAQPEMVEHCWDEEVEVQAEARDQRAIAGTAAGALIGGAIADRIGDDDDLVTAAGAAAGAFLGRRAQREYQENRTTTEIVRRCEQVAAR